MFNMMTGALLEATWQTCAMVFWASLIAACVGVPLGVLLWASDQPLCWQKPVLHKVLTAIVNVMRSIPFIILMIALIPLTRFLVGSTIGTAAAVVPLAISAMPFLARVVESALCALPAGLLEAAAAMGATPQQILCRFLLPEALPAIVRGILLTAVTLVGYSAMAGAVGGGGLGDLAIRYGYNRFDLGVMLMTVIVLIVLVQCMQWLGDTLANCLEK